MNEHARIRYEPLADSVFNYIFAENSLKGFAVEMINSVLRDAGDDEIRFVEDLKTQYDVQKRVIGAHGGRLDVRAVADDGSLFDIEVCVLKAA